MKTDRQSRKHAIGIAGEFLVAGELLRRGIMASVTYGNAKKADVIASNESLAVPIEVKSTSAGKWVLGALPEASTRVWVLVHLPADVAQSPEYFVLTSKELRDIVIPNHEAYCRKYLEKHGKLFHGNGVSSITRAEIPEGCRGAWDTIVHLLQAGS